MKIKSLLKRCNLETLKINLKVVEAQIRFTSADQDAAWELHIEMLTRIVTQPLSAESGDEKTALESVYALFGLTREILRRHGRKTIHFSKVAIPVLNQVVRPFTAKWHKESLAGAFNNARKRKAFREELETLQNTLRNYNHMLAKIAEVEDLTDLEQTTREYGQRSKKDPKYHG